MKGNLICFAFSASVAAVFILDDDTGAEIRFQRSVINSSSEYRINNNVSIYLFHVTVLNRTAQI